MIFWEYEKCFLKLTWKNKEPRKISQFWEEKKEEIRCSKYEDKQLKYNSNKNKGGSDPRTQISPTYIELQGFYFELGHSQYRTSLFIAT